MILEPSCKKVLFIDQNFPGQFRHLAPVLQREGHDVLALADVGKSEATP